MDPDIGPEPQNGDRAADLVEAHLAQDIVLGHLVARGDVDPDRAAQWLVEVFDWDVCPRTVASLLRHYVPPPNPDLEAARDILYSADTSLQPGWAMIEVLAVAEVVSQFPMLLRNLPPGANIVVHGSTLQGSIIVLDDEHVARVRALLGTTLVQKTHRGIQKMTFHFSEEGTAAALASALAVRSFLHGGLDVLAFEAGSSGVHVLYPGKHAAAASNVVVALLSPDPGSGD